MNQPDWQPVSQETQEVRLATTMTGGVSLAVWMGGVAREMDLLRQASNRRRAGADESVAGQGRTNDGPIRLLYRRLLDLLDQVVEQDVLSGTSAGGINAALLAHARVHDGDLGPLRDMWLELGSLQDLLREPSDPDVTSLLYGDRRMLRDLNEQIGKLVPETVPTRSPSTTLYITTTLLTGESSRFTDDLGTVVQDTTQRALFTFTQDDLRRPAAGAALALAARSSASFPGAFEPSFVPYDKEVKPAGEVPARPPMHPYTDITRSHWVVDGGVLNNQPLDVLLQRVFRRPARRPVRRVLMFVVPSPGPSPDLAKAAPADDVNAPYDLIDGLLKVVGAATSQSIGTSLREIVAHNDRVTARLDLRRRLAELATRLTGDRLLSTALLTDFLEREGERQARRLARAMMRQIDTWPPRPAKAKDTVGVPPSWRSDLDLGSSTEAVCRTAITRTLNKAWSPAAPDGQDRRPETMDQFAGFGQSLFDDVKSIALSAVRTAHEAATTEDQRRLLITGIEWLHAAVGQPSRPATADLARTVCESAVRVVDPPSLIDTATELGRAWLAGTAVSPGSWAVLAGVLAGLAKTVDAVATPRRGEPPTPNQAELRVYVAYLGLNRRSPDTTSIARRLFDLATAEKALLPVESRNLQKVELVQLSADTRCLLDPNRHTAQDKLTGLQVHNFGAFYKRSWRANDWMWGRLDAAGWLVHTLLDPRRLVRIADRRGIPPAGRAHWLFDELAAFLPDDAVVGRDTATRADVLSELAKLTVADLTALPRSLPTTSQWLATAWQTLIGSEELPRLAGEVDGSAEGSNTKVERSPSASRRWTMSLPKKLTGDDAVRDALTRCPVPMEKLTTTEKGTPLMVRTLTKAAATTTAALSSMRQLPGVARPAVTTMHTIALGGFRVANSTRAHPARLLLIGLVLLAVGAVAASTGILGIPALAVAAAGGYLLTFAVWQRGPRLWGSLLGITLVLGVFALTTPVVRPWLFGTSETDVGVLGRNIHWLADEWWHPLVAVGILLVIVTMVGVGLNASRRKNRRRLVVRRSRPIDGRASRRPARMSWYRPGPTTPRTPVTTTTAPEPEVVGHP